MDQFRSSAEEKNNFVMDSGRAAKDYGLSVPKVLLLLGKVVGRIIESLKYAFCCICW